MVILIKPVGDYRTWQLRANSASERDVWLELIQQVLTQNAETRLARNAPKEAVARMSLHS
jgi:hypothetical protein